MALLRVRETVMGPIRETLAQSGINEQKWRVLRVLEERGPMELTGLAGALFLMLPSLTRMVRPMGEEGLIVRSTPFEDRRKGVAGITETGRHLIRTHLAASNAIFARLEAEFGAEKLEQLLDLLEELQAMDLRGQPAGDGQTGWPVSALS
jgi:homoprotocatechuate degradation regulator HpaR